MTFRQWLSGWNHGSCVSEFMSYWPLVAASNISAVPHRPRCQHYRVLNPTLFVALLNRCKMRQSCLAEPSVDRLKKRSPEKSKPPSRWQEFNFKTSDLLKIGPSVQQLMGPSSSSSQAVFFFFLAEEENRNGQADFWESECMQGWREVTIDWREVESRKNKKENGPEKSKTQPCTVLPCPEGCWLLKFKKSSNSFFLLYHIWFTTLTCQKPFAFRPRLNLFLTLLDVGWYGFVGFLLSVNRWKFLRGQWSVLMIITDLPNTKMLISVFTDVTLKAPNHAKIHIFLRVK